MGAVGERLGRGRRSLTGRRVGVGDARARPSARVRRAWVWSTAVQVRRGGPPGAGSAGWSESFQSPWPYAGSGLPGTVLSVIRATRAPQVLGDRGRLAVGPSSPTKGEQLVEQLASPVARR